MSREAFEADAAPYGFDLTRQECAAPEPWSEYADEATGHRWAGWLAALAYAYDDAANVCEERVMALDNAGKEYRREATASQCAEAIRKRAKEVAR
jgi:hypothetical protein